MKFEELLKVINGEQLFKSSLLLAGDITAASVHSQLSRWVLKNKLFQLRRGLYAVAGPYRETEPHPFLIANMLKKASYISLESALEYYGIIPEYVPVITSVTTGRPEEINTRLGKFKFRHLKKELFWGYIEMEIIKGTRVFIASTEKALLDLMYITPQSDNMEFIKELRLQNTEKINTDILKKYTDGFGTPKIHRAVHLIIKIIQSNKI